MTRVKEFNLPDLGEGLTEGEILKWLVSVGDTVALNQPIVEVETAKAAVEIPAKWAGKVTAIFRAEGEVVEVGTPIIAIDTEPGAGPQPPAGPGDARSASEGLADQPGTAGDARSASEGPAGQPGTAGDARSASEGPAGQPGTAGESPTAPPSPERTAVLVGYGPRTSAAKRRPRKDSAHPAPAVKDVPPPAVAQPVPPAKPAAELPVALAKPPVRRLAKDLGVELGSLTGTGPQGSITRDDVLTARPAAYDGAREQRVPVKGVRKLTAENMVASAFTAPHVTEFLTVDITRSMRMLDRLRALPDWPDIRVSPLLLVAKAVLVVLRRYPMVNSTWRGDEIIVKEYVNLGIAAATERGLIVPNIKDADRMSTRQLAEAMNALVSTAKEGRTAPADMAGGTFTITNVGVFGVDTGTPILPPGEAAILAFGAVRKQPWAHKGKIKLRQVTTLGLSFDHRIIDGELGSKFLRDVGAFLVDPEVALLGWA